MKDKPPSEPQRSWLEKLSYLFAGDPKDQDELMEQLEEAHTNQLLDNEAFSIIQGAMSASKMQVRDIMIPRSQMISIKAETDPKTWLHGLIKSGHSRFPVIGEHPDEVRGILIAKELLPLLLQESLDKLDISAILRPAIFIPESKRLTILLNEFRTNRYHMAIVVDEYGGIAGLVTIEDVLEEIVGDIEDETDVQEAVYIQTVDANTATVKAITPIDTFNEHFSSRFSDDEFDTIGGIVMQAFGYLPKTEESIQIGKWHFHIIQADSRRIQLLKVTAA